MTATLDQMSLDEVLVGRSAVMKELREQAARLAQCNVTILLEGESGTGKEVMSRAIHRLSDRADGPFIGVNCAAIHESLLESELFGHVAGAFTGADKPGIGFLRAAEGGTVLLDEVGDMSPTLQSKLLRVLEERAVIPVGSTEAIPVNIRVIAATNRDLAQAVEEGTFRSDLYYRLNVVRLHLPGLRQRRGDVPVLVEHFLQEAAETLEMSVKTLSPAALEAMENYAWPGNIRQLANMIQRAYVLCRGEQIQPCDLPRELTSAIARDAEDAEMTEGDMPSLDEAIRRHVMRVLAACGGVRSDAAKTLQIDRKSLWRMIRRYNIG